jgi:hypothetical protein
MAAGIVEYIDTLHRIRQERYTVIVVSTGDHETSVPSKNYRSAEAMLDRDFE